MRYTALVDGHAGAYGVVIPDVRGCHAMGDTVEEALANAADALRDVVEIMRKRGEAIPRARTAEDVRSDPKVAEALRADAFLASVPLVLPTGKPARANLSLDSGVLEAIDAEALRRKLTRSALIEMMARHALPSLA